VGLSQGPPHHYWYLWLDKILPKRDIRTVVLKIFADQLVAAPFFAFTFFFGMGILEDKRMSECWNEFVKKFPTVYLVSYYRWNRAVLSTLRRNLNYWKLECKPILFSF
jgi:protein Mpv17